MIESAIREILLASSALQALIGGRYYAQHAPEDEAPPYVVYQTADQQQLQCLDGSFDDEQGALFRFDCYGGSRGASYSAAKAIAQAIHDRFASFRRGPAGAAGLFIEGVLLEGGEDGAELPAFGEEEPGDFVSLRRRVFFHFER